MQRARRAAVLLVLGAALGAGCKRDNPSYAGDAGAGPDLSMPGDDLAGTEDDLAGADLTMVEPPDLAGADLTGAQYQLSVADTNVTEGDDGVTALVFTVTVSSVSPQPITFEYATADGTAKSDDADYLAVQGRLTLPAGETSLTIEIPVLGDLTDEPNETLSLTIFNPTNASILVPTATGVIKDDDDAPEVSVDDAAGYEGGNASAGVVPFRVWLSAPSGRTVTVTYATAAGTATTADFTPKAGTLTFAPGETEKQVSVPILADTANEGTETFTLGLTTSTNTTIVRSTATGTIYDDDGGVPVLSTTAQMVNEGDVGTTSMVFTVSVPAIVISAISFHATTHAINATEGVDYTGVDADFAINTASNAVDITVPIIGDTMAEDLESFVLVLSAPMGATISTPMVLGRIKDDDEAPTLTFTPQSDTEGDLGATLQFVPMSLSAPAGHDVTVRIATMSQTAASPDDFAATTGLVRIPAGVDTWECAVPINGDLTTEPDETYRINASMPVNLKLAASSISCTIENDD